MYTNTVIIDNSTTITSGNNSERKSVGSGTAFMYQKPHRDDLLDCPVLFLWRIGYVDAVLRRRGAGATAGSSNVCKV